ncbi:UNVERIFIED_CONTAM: putative mitochondrial protein [Sesamum radiatum]|uniref:Mitochondrial protein n=1 Tax=Sesamum radiatum TaxID=300843 RepID=A0AAW2JV08_SESRA
MPDELPRKLPPKRAVDHEIELVPSTKPPARAPYRMSQPELVELRKQLKDMFETRRAMRQRRQWSRVEPWPSNLEHLRQVLTRLYEHELYAKVSKCSFAQATISFLGHIVEGGRIWMDPKKVQAIEEWRPPSDVHDLRSFLGLVNYYRRFVKGYSKIARPMTDLLKKTKTWNWTLQCQVAFDNLKRAIVTNPVLALPDMSKPFAVETDALDFALGWVLMQNDL